MLSGYSPFGTVFALLARQTPSVEDTGLDQHFPSSEIRDEAERIPPKKERIIEITVFLFLIVPSMLLSFFGVQQGGLPFWIVAASTIFRDLGLLFLVLFLAWRDREPVSRLGWHAKHVWREILLGVLLFIPVYYGAVLLQSLLQSRGFSSPDASAPGFMSWQGPWGLVLAAALVLVVAITEETLFRGYLILRFMQITDNRWVALLASSVIFALGHGYQGGAGVVTILGIGLAFGLVYLWRKSIVAPIVMHFLQNFISIVVAPFLMQ
jgi:membrane protease YdiL (CAAX protease family)